MANTQKPAKPVSATQAAKSALKEAGYEVVSCKFGRGTARSWIEVKVRGPWTEKEFRDNHYGQAYGIVKHAAGRDHLHDDIQTDLFMEQISLDYEPRLPTEEEYAGMDLEARAETLRWEIGRMKDYGAESGPAWDLLQSDLAATLAARAAHAPQEPAAEASGPDVPPVEPEPDPAPVEAAEPEGINWDDYAEADYLSGLHDAPEVVVEEENTEETVDMNSAEVIPLGERIAADIEAKAAAENIPEAFGPVVEAPKKKRRGGRKSKAQVAAEAKAHLPVAELANLVDGIRAVQSSAKQILGDIRAVYGPESVVEAEIQTALVGLKLVEGEVAEDLAILRPADPGPAEFHVDRDVEHDEREADAWGEINHGGVF